MSTPSLDQTGPSIAPLGAIARQERAAKDAIRSTLADLGFDLGPKPVDLRPMPFEGTWGSASTICRMVAGDAVNAELAASGDLEGLSKKDVKKLVNDRVGDKAQEIASQVAERMSASGRFASVEAVNGYINISYDAHGLMRELVNEVFAADQTYGHAAPDSRGVKVMIEHSQLNTHKAAHVGHLRNICLGTALTNIATASGFTTIPVTYIGDMGRHVVRTLWCYTNFHKDDEPPTGHSRGRWIGDLYAEASSRLGFRDDALAFVKDLVGNDPAFVESIDNQLKHLWHNPMPIDGEDIAYLLGKVTSDGEIVPDDLLDDNVMVAWWPIIGEQLQAELTVSDDDSRPGAEARLASWQAIDAHMAEWWPNVPRWNDEAKATFQLWEDQDPAFVDLWKTTREWSMDELRAIFDEFGAHFVEWYSESDVENAGREIVRELLQRGIAEISEGLPVVKIDEKLGLDKDTYLTLPILRSDGTTLYSTKDLALAKKKFTEHNIDQSIWVVDVRQSLYFDQITQILKLYGFDRADALIHESYDFVQLPTGIMSSRSGKAPLLEDVRGTMLRRAADVIAEKNPEMPADQREKAAHDIAIGSIKYVMLARDGNKVITFDPDEALSFDGHAAPYIQYAHARACRILENGDIDLDAPVSELGDLNADASLAPEELSLLQQISAFPEVVTRAADERRPLHLTNFVFELAKRFNDFYHACPVLQAEGDIRARRLALVSATRITLRNGLALLAIAAPTQM